MADSWEITTTAFEMMGSQFRDASDRAMLEMNKALLQVGAEVTAGAKIEASKHSQTIPGKIHMEPGNGFVSIKADGILARLEEVGGSKGYTKTGRRRGFKHQSFTTAEGRAVKGWRHPVFGNQDVQVMQEAHPYIRPTFRAMRRHVTQRLTQAQTDAMDAVRGFDG